MAARRGRRPARCRGTRRPAVRDARHMLLWNLTGGPAGGVHATDPSNAARTLLMDLRTLDWDDELLDAMEIPRAVLPEIRSSSEVYGTAGGGPSRGAGAGLPRGPRRPPLR